MSIKDQYELIEPLGENSYATVYDAYDMSADRPVAIMVLRDHLSSNASQWNHAWSELLDRIKCKHEYLVAVHQVDKAAAWIVMEKMNGHLGQHVASIAVAPEAVRTVLRRSLEALSWLHEQGKCHGNLKPSSLLFDREGFIKLSFSPGLTLGDAVLRQDHHKYVAPELLKPESYGEAGSFVDQYGIGLAALELLVGPAFDELVPGADANSPNPDLAWMRFHVSESQVFPPVAEIVPDAPNDLAVVIDRLLQKKVSDRYQSIGDALSELDTTAQDVAVETDIEPAMVSSGSGQPVRDSSVTVPVPNISRDEPPAASKPTPPKPTSSNSKRSSPSGKSPRGKSPSGIAFLKKFFRERKTMAISLSAVAVLCVLVTMMALVPSNRRKFVIRSIPEGATVLIDGVTIPGANPETGEQGQAITPIQYSAAADTSFDVELTLEAHESWSGKVTVPLDGEIEPILLTPSARPFHFKSTPPGATLSLTSSSEIQSPELENAKTPFEVSLTPGEYHVTVSYSPNRAVSRVIRLPAGTEPHAEHFDLTRRVELSLAAAGTPEISVSLDKTDLGTSNEKKRIIEIPESVPDVGTVDIQIAADGFQTQTKTIDVSKINVLKKLTVALEELPPTLPMFNIPLALASANLDLKEIPWGRIKTTSVTVNGEPVALANGTGIAKVAEGMERDQLITTVVHVDGFKKLEEKQTAAHLVDLKQYTLKLHPELKSVKFEFSKNVAVPIELSLDQGDYQVVSGTSYTFEFPRLSDPSQTLQLAARAEGFPNVSQQFDYQTLLDRESIDVAIRKPFAELFPDDYIQIGEDVDLQTGLPLIVAPDFANKELNPDDAPMSFSLVRSGQYQSGASSLHASELPASEFVVEEPFYISTFEVTNSQYAVFAAHNSSLAGDKWKPSPADQPGDLPVVNVSYEQAKAFSNWIGRGSQGVLPTEMEWEAAARGPNARKYPWNESISLSTDVANLRDGSPGKLMPVLSLKNGRNSSGLGHLLGNASEWCRDIYSAGFNDGNDTPGVGVNRVIRGGSYLTDISSGDSPSVRLTWRSNYPEGGGSSVGFRPTLRIATASTSPSEKQVSPANEDQ